MLIVFHWQLTVLIDSIFIINWVTVR